MDPQPLLTLQEVFLHNYDLKVFSIYNSDVGNSFYVQADGKVTAQSFDLESLTALP